MSTLTFQLKIFNSKKTTMSNPKPWTHTQDAYNTLFQQLAKTFNKHGWLTSQEPIPVGKEAIPDAYLHISKSNWGDEKMNGIHFETYVLKGQLESKFAPVCLHCESGCKFQKKFMQLMTQRAKPIIESWNASAPTRVQF